MSPCRFELKFRPYKLGACRACNDVGVKNFDGLCRACNQCGIDASTKREEKRGRKRARRRAQRLSDTIPGWSEPTPRVTPMMARGD